MHAIVCFTCALILVSWGAIHGGTPKTDASRCQPVDGAEALWSRADLRFINVGEAHGTNEVPAIFADLVCAARSTGRPIIVGLELQELPVGYFDAPTRKIAEQTILKTLDWRTSLDGRTSRAMLAMMSELRDLKRKGIVKQIVPISVSRMVNIDSSSQDSMMKGAAAGEKAMAQELLEAAATAKEALVITLTGNLHAAKRRGEPGMIPYDSMGTYLPPERTIALDIDHHGGKTWGCQLKSGKAKCGVMPWNSTHKNGRGVILGVKADRGPEFDGILSIGTPVTPSRPAPTVPNVHSSKPRGST